MKTSRNEAGGIDPVSAIAGEPGDEGDGEEDSSAGEEEDGSATDNKPGVSGIVTSKNTTFPKVTRPKTLLRRKGPTCQAILQHADADPFGIDVTPSKDANETVVEDISDTASDGVANRTAPSLGNLTEAADVTAVKVEENAGLEEELNLTLPTSPVVGEEGRRGGAFGNGTIAIETLGETTRFPVEDLDNGTTGSTAQQSNPPAEDSATTGDGSAFGRLVEKNCLWWVYQSQ